MDIIEIIEKVLKIIAYLSMAIYWIRKNLKDR